MFQIVVAFVQIIILTIAAVGCGFAVVILAYSLVVAAESIFSAQTRRDTFGDSQWIGFSVLSGGSCLWIIGCLFALFFHKFF